MVSDAGVLLWGRGIVWGRGECKARTQQLGLRGVCLTKRRSLGFQATLESTAQAPRSPVLHLDPQGRRQPLCAHVQTSWLGTLLMECCHPPGYHWPVAVISTRLEGTATSAEEKWVGGQDWKHGFSFFRSGITQRQPVMVAGPGSLYEGDKHKINQWLAVFFFYQILPNVELVSHRPLLYHTGTGMKVLVPGCQLGALITRGGEERMFLSLARMMGTLKNGHLCLKWMPCFCLNTPVSLCPYIPLGYVETKHVPFTQG